MGNDTCPMSHHAEEWRAQEGPVSDPAISGLISGLSPDPGVMPWLSSD